MLVKEITNVGYFLGAGESLKECGLFLGSSQYDK